jgi:hypothetical protein
MQLHRLGKSLFGKAALASVALSGLLFLAGAPGAQAADRDDGHRRVTTERHFDSDRGHYNRQADNWREDRREAYEHSNREYAGRDYRSNWDRDRSYGRSRDYNRYQRDRDRD